MLSKKDDFSRYDVADYLKSKEEIAAYLDACLDDAGDDASFIAAALGDVARAHGVEQLARDAGISREDLDNALSPDGNASLAAVLKMMKALGLQLTTKVA